VTAKHRFDAIEIDAEPAYLDLPVLAADSLQQSVGPLTHEIAGTKNPRSALPAGFETLVRKTSIGPSSQGNVSASDDELSDCAGRRRTTLFID
jgi:hypothetical protein